MTDRTASGAVPAPRNGSLLTQDARTKQRNAKKARFRMMGLIAVTIGVLSLVGPLTSILASGLSSFQQTYVAVEVSLDPAKLDKKGERNLTDIAKISTFGYAPLIEVAMIAAIERTGVTSDVANAKAAGELISKEAPATLRDVVLVNPDLNGETMQFDLLAAGRIDGFFKGFYPALPVQVNIWIQRGDPAVVERASGAVIVLLVFLVIMNIAAILLRRRFERRW